MEKKVSQSLLAHQSNIQETTSTTKILRSFPPSPLHSQLEINHTQRTISSFQFIAPCDYPSFIASHPNRMFHSTLTHPKPYPTMLSINPTTIMTLTHSFRPCLPQFHLLLPALSSQLISPLP